MTGKVTAVAYPTIPIVFVSSVHPRDRIPLHNTMGLAVTDKARSVRTETSVSFSSGTKDVNISVNGKPLDSRRAADALNVVEFFRKASGDRRGLAIASRNFDTYSGSSDAGAAALVTALDGFFGTGLPLERLSLLAQSVSESAVRSLYGGLSELNVDGYPCHHGRLVAGPEGLRALRIFALTFDYPSRVSAQEIFQATRSNPFYKCHLKRVPVWIAQIRRGLARHDWDAVFSAAEANCASAHYLAESAGVRCRRKGMMAACIDVEEIRASGLPCYWTAGGGNVINVFSWGPGAAKVAKELACRGHRPKEYFAAPGAEVIRR